ncbi:MAG: MFS transporter [Rhodospirillales bacterium]|nr:MFS transporter [Rhodospirillales bacterium]
MNAAALDRRRGFAVAIAGVAAFINLYAPQAILPSLAHTFHVPLLRTGLTVTAPLLAVAALAPFVGAISDRLGRKRLIAGAILFMLLPTLGIAAAPNFPVLLALRFAQGLAVPFIITVTVAYIGDECPGGEAIRAAGSYAIGSILGGFAGRFVAGIAADLGGWRVAFVAIAALTLATWLWIVARLPAEQRFVPTTGGLRATFTAYAEHLRNPRLLATCGIGFGMLFTNVAVFTFVNFDLAAPPLDLSPGALAFVFVTYLVGAATTSPFTRLAVRIGRRPTLMLVLATAASGLAITLAPGLAAAIAGLAVFVAGIMAVQALSMGFIGDIVPRARSSAVGLYVTLFYIGGSLGGIVPASAWRAARWPGVVALLLIVLAIMAGLGAAFWRSRPPRERFIQS